MHPYGPYRISCLWGCGNPRVALPVPCRCRNPPQTDETDRRSGSSSWLVWFLRQCTATDGAHHLYD